MKYIILFVVVSILTIVLKKLIKENENNEIKNNVSTIYKVKPIMTEYERKFYNILTELNNQYTIIPQLNLASVVKKINNDRYYSELFRNIDFAIFDKDMQNLLLLIEINDNTHNRKDRKSRDLKVKNICKNANIELITFYTQYPNERNYVLNRVLECLRKNDTTINNNNNSN